MQSALPSHLHQRSDLLPTHTTAPLSSPRTRRLRPALFLAVIGVYALAFIVWCVRVEHNALLPLHYNERLERMLALLTSHHTTDASTTGNTPHECIGWRHTMDCDPLSDVVQSFNRSCDFIVRGGNAGYCAVRNRTTGREVRTMRATCAAVRLDVQYNCTQALDFVAFQHEVNAVATTAQSIAHATLQHTIANATRGIVLVVYPKALVSTFAVVRTLRELLNCSLPLELWYLASEFSNSTATTTVSATPPVFLQTLATTYGPVTLRAIPATAQVVGFAAKVYGIVESQFDQVLFLDADNFPVTDPTFLFDTPEFLTTGALFWPDFWHPNHTIFNIHNTSLLWELVDLAPVDMFEQESGQLVIDRTRHAAALAVVKFMALRRPSVLDALRLAWGDKDLFRLAWLKMNSPFHMVERPPAIAGLRNQTRFCGATMAQFDPEGTSILFLHRNAMKLTGGRQFETSAGVANEPTVNTDDARIWTHLQTFAFNTNASVDGNNTILVTDRLATDEFALATEFTRLKRLYKVGIYKSDPAFPTLLSCYGREFPTTERHFTTVAWHETGIRDIEPDVLRFARAGAALLQQTMDGDDDRDATT